MNDNLKIDRTREYGIIFVYVEREAYIAGETVTGKILLNLIKDFPG